MRLLGLILFVGVFACALNAGNVPEEIRDAIRELRETEGVSIAGRSAEAGIFVVGIGRCSIEETKRKSVSTAQKVANTRLKEVIASFFGTQIESTKTYSYEEKTNGDKDEVNEYFASLTKSQVKQLLKGIQFAEQHTTQDGVVEVVGFVTSRMMDASGELEGAQKAWGDRGVVKATGVDSDRRKAEQEALRSAVEQVAGTLVVGKTTLNEEDDLRSRLATTASALVEEYRILEEKFQDGQYFVVVAARVSKRKIYESYRSYFKALDNPTFYLNASDRELADAFKRYFIDKGVAITENLSEANYVIRLTGRFVERKNPVLDSMGTTLTITLEVCSTDGKTTLFQLPTKRFSKDSEILTQEQRRDEVANRAFRDLKTELDEAVHQMVIRMLDNAE